MIRTGTAALAQSVRRFSERSCADNTNGDDAMARIVADYMAETLKQAGVKRVYGVVGDTLNGFTDAMRRIGGIEWMHRRHEEAGACVAGAEAHLPGEIAVCAGSCVPGNLHIINGLSD